MAAAPDNPDFHDSRALNRQLVSALAEVLDLPAYPLRRAEPGQMLAQSGQLVLRRGVIEILQPAHCVSLD